MAKILVTGGAGYIGSHVVKKLLKERYKVLAVDNFSTGFVEPITLLSKKYSDLSYIKADLSDRNALEKIFRNYQISDVIHLAAKTDVAESMTKPDLYHKENYLNSINLLEIMLQAGVKNIIFSSSAAVYGNPGYTPIDEKHPTHPTSPYGQTKLDFEKYLAKIKNINFIILRYFNVGGSDSESLIGKSHTKSQDLMENLMKVALGQKEFFEIFGDDFETPDGTAIRDFVHVEDIAQAHLLALKNLEIKNREIFNLGSESGFSVKEIIDKATSIIHKEIPIHIVEKRPGDITISRADASKAKTNLAWKPEYSDLGTIIKTDWDWRKEHPLGYTN